MKRIFCLLLAFITLGCFLSGCLRKSGAELPVRCYVLEGSDEEIKPSVILQDDHKFSFTYSLLSSYLASGSYEISDDSLVLKTDDGANTYVFHLKDDTLIFDAEKSSAIPSYANLSDGAVFK